MDDQSLAALRSIYSSIPQRVRKFVQGASCLNSPSQDPPPLNLPLPKEITTSLLEAGCPSKAMADEISTRYVKSAMKIREVYQTSHSKQYQKALHMERFSPGIVSTFECGVAKTEQDYKMEIENIEKKAFTMLEAFLEKRRLSPTPHLSKPAFNQDSIPLLEDFFRDNSYPNSYDREVLARKCCMSTRQIEVWFQNRRTRGKRDGKSLSKNLKNSTACQKALDVLKRTRPSYIHSKPSPSPCPSTSASSSQTNVSSEPEVVKETSVPSHPGPEQVPTISATAPLHAFPTPYSSKNRGGTLSSRPAPGSFPPPTWYRKCVVHQPSSTSQEIDIETLCQDFASKLHLRGQPKTADSETPHHCYNATVTILPQAPLPALIPTNIPEVKSSVPKPFQSIRLARSSRRTAFSQIVPTTLVPTSTKCPESPERKTRRKKPYDRDHSLRRSSSSSSIESSTDSCTSSLSSSSTRTRRRSSSSSSDSLSTSGSSMPTTPTREPLPLLLDGTSSKLQSYADPRLSWENSCSAYPELFNSISPYDLTDSRTSTVSESPWLIR